MAAIQRKAPVHVVPYEPSWPTLFACERAELERALAPWLAGPIEHVGTTSVPGPLAKPVIDLMAGVVDLIYTQAKEPLVRRVFERALAEGPETS